MNVDPGFWSGAGAAGLTGLFAWIISKFRSKESLEDRLSRWQESTVARVQAENDGLRREITELKAVTSRLPIVEACLRLAVEALYHVAPEAPELRQIGTLLRKAFPVDADTPDEFRDMVAKLDRKSR